VRELFTPVLGNQPCSIQSSPSEESKKGLRLNSVAQESRGSCVHAIHGLSRFAMLASIGSRLLTIAAQVRRAPVPICRLGTIEENPAALFRRAGLQAREPIRIG
jgi:hypothetical protein